GPTAPAWPTTTRSRSGRCSVPKGPASPSRGASDVERAEISGGAGNGGRAGGGVRLARLRHAPEPGAGPARRCALGVLVVERLRQQRAAADAADRRLGGRLVPGFRD